MTRLAVARDSFFGRKFESPNGVFDMMGFDVYLKWYENTAHITIFDQNTAYSQLFLGIDDDGNGLAEAWAKVYQYVLELE